MAKTKQKTHSETEHLKGENKRLKSENRNLKKRLKTLERREHFFEDVIHEIADDEIQETQTCNECGKGQVEVLDLKFIIIEKCNICEYRKKLK